MSSPKLNAWIGAMRLRTLPLALSSIILGSMLSASAGKYRWSVSILAILTTVFLQVLSNLANDYGDGVKGTDNHERIGPQRAIQSGLISPVSMKRAVYFSAFLALVFGVCLVWVSYGPEHFGMLLLFLALGLASVLAAVKYTMGKWAYGYHGLGDLFVFLFFGLTGVCGVWVLQTHTWDWWILLPASSIGLLSSGVLNLNNLRDRQSDKAAGKNTLVVKLGIHGARLYHTALLFGAVGLGMVYVSHRGAGWPQMAFLLTLPLLLLNLKAVWTWAPVRLDPQLRILALTTLIFSLVLGWGQLQ